MPSHQDLSMGYEGTVSSIISYLKSCKADERKGSPRPSSQHKGDFLAPEGQRIALHRGETDSP